MPGPAEANTRVPTVPGSDSPPTGASEAKPGTPAGTAATVGANPVAVTRQAIASQLQTRILAGGATNALEADVQASDLPRLPVVALQWRSSPEGAGCREGSPTASAEVLAKAPLEGNNSKTQLTLFIPRPPCWWPVYQYAQIAVIGDVAEAGNAPRSRVFFDGTVRVSVRWFPLLVTLIAVGFIYPGCAMIAWRAERRRASRGLAGKTIIDVITTPTLWKKLDPVQITANMYGRASLPKLQIFAFSLIIFGLLLYSQVRNGLLSGLSTDVLLLLGISGVGTAGARYTYSAKRRISLESWAWLRSKQWLPNEETEKRRADIASQATWAELVTDVDNKEFDIYSFQMAIFSVVVAAALLSTNLTGLATFEIPDELLGLLGLSQAIFIGGKAIEKSPFAELDQKLASVRARERDYQEATVKAASAPTDPDAQAKAKAQAEGLRADLVEAADMFWALYADVLKAKPQALTAVANGSGLPVATVGVMIT